MRTSIFQLLGLAFLAACATVAVTGRTQLSLVSNAEIIAMSTAQYDEVLSTAEVVNSGDQAEMVKRVGTRIQTAVEAYLTENGQGDQLSEFDWQFNLLKDDQTLNAWAMPGGKVAFYTGIMPVCKDELGVAVVMGHEVAHAIANHGAERMSQGIALQFGLSTLGGAMEENPTLTKQILLQSLGMGSQLGILAFSRKHESEADKIGLIFMAIAGYDPREAPRFWERMAANGGAGQPEWLSTHPSHETRISDLNASMDEALQYYNSR